MNERRISAEPGSPLALARIAAHTAFDPLWQSGLMSRSQAYSWLAEKLDIPKHNCHMVMFDIGLCNNVVAVCQEAGIEPRTAADDFEVIE